LIKRHSSAFLLLFLLGLGPSARADFNTCAVPWSAFTNVRDYTLGGEAVRDYELAADPTNGGSSVPPAETDLASGSPGSYPGPRTTPGFAYYDGGTPWDPLNPSTMEDDHVLFRMRLRGTPETSKHDFSSYHWNVLFDVDGDGYKEYWIDINGTYQSSGDTDQLQILYSNLNSQLIASPSAAKVSEYSISALPLTTTGCTSAGSPGLSHTRVYSVVSVDPTDLSGDYILEAQMPLTAFNDLQGNQVVYPNSPIAFMFSTGASNQDPLQKDLMANINYISSADPITFGDVVTFAGVPVIRFITATGADNSFYTPGDPIYVELNYPTANTNSTSVDCTTVSITDPYTGDQETIPVCETGPNTGVFTNFMGPVNRVSWNDADQNFAKGAGESTNLNGWLVGLTPTAATTAATWTFRYVDAAGTANDGWDVYRNGVLQNTVANRLKPGTSGVTYTNSEFSVQLYQDTPVNNDSIQFSLNPPLPTTSGTNTTGVLKIAPGDTLYAVYPSTGAIQTTDSAFVLGTSTDACSTRSLVYLSRAEGSNAPSFQVESTVATSDKFWVTVIDPARNTNATTQQTVSVTVTSRLTGDSETFTLTETDINTGVFRNSAGRDMKLTDGSVAANDGTLEVGDADTLTVTYTSACGASQTDTATTDSSAGGVIAFTDSTGTLDGTYYTVSDPVYLKVTDTTWSTCSATLVVTMKSCAPGNFTTPPDACSSPRDTESVTVKETAAGSGQFMNVGSGTTAITAVTSATGTANNGLLEALDGDILITSYSDCNDGDSIAANNTKTDTAYYFADPKIPSITETAVATRATLMGVKVDISGLVEFATGAQKGTRAFRLYETDDPRGGGLVSLVDAPVPALRPDSVTPLVYRVPTRPISRSFVAIEEIEIKGATRILAVVPVSDLRLAAAFDRVAQRLEITEKVRREAAFAAGRSRRPKMLATAGTSAVKALRIATSGAGAIQIPWSTLVSLGAPEKASGVKLTSRGHAVPMTLLTGPSGLLTFTAESLRADYTNTNSYILTWGGGKAPDFAGLTGERPGPGPGTIRIERTGVYASSAPLSSDPFQWDLLTPVEDLGLWGGEGDETWPYSWWQPEDGRFDLPALSAGATGAAQVRVRVLGASAHTHTLEAWINGAFVGTLSFTGSMESTLTGSIPLSALRTSGNQIELRYRSGTSGGYLYFDAVDITAPFAPSAPTATVAEIAPFDPTVPSSAGVQYLIVTHSDFMAAAQRIAAAKEAEGLKTAVVDVERAYDRYTGGLADPKAVQGAIREFFRNGALRYALVMGDDSIDPTDNFGFGTRFFMPSFQAWTAQSGRFASETGFTDVDGDGAPDLAIGRIPVETSDEASVAASKIERERALVAAFPQSHLLAVDDGFLAKGSIIRSWLPEGATLTVADNATGTEAARETIFSTLSNGAGVTHYFGHGGPAIWADEWLLSTDDMPRLAGTPPSVFFMWACQAQWYQYFWGKSLGEALFLLEDGGSVASFGPTGVTTDDQQAVLARMLYPKVLGEGLSLGEAIRQAKRSAAALGAREAVDGFVLIGDPALVIRPRN
jgi:hypothetical protein